MGARVLLFSTVLKLLLNFKTEDPRTELFRFHKFKESPRFFFHLRYPNKIVQVAHLYSNCALLILGRTILQICVDK